MRLASPLALSLLFVLGIGCTKDDSASEPTGTYYPSDLDVQPTYDCWETDCASNAPGVDWRSDTPTYIAHIRVVDEAGEPVQGAVVSIAGVDATSDETGRVTVGDVPAGKPAPVAIAVDGKTPTMVRTSFFESGKTNQEVVVQPVGVVREFSPEEQTVIGHAGAQVEIGPKSLIRDDGSRADRAKVWMTHFEGDRMPAMVRGPAQTQREVPTVLEDPVGVTYVRFEDMGGKGLNIAPGQTATLSVPVAQSKGMNEGDKLDLWSLDEDSQVWTRESSCTIASQVRGGETSQVCVGPVSHFSFWAVSKELDIYQPDSLGCFNATMKTPEDVCYTVEAVSQQILECGEDAEDCDDRILRPPYESWNRNSEAVQDFAYCGVMNTGEYARVALTYVVNTDECGKDDDAPRDGRRVWLSPTFTLDSFQDVLGSDLMLSFTLSEGEECASLCQAVELEVTREVIEAAVWVDFDDDGAYIWKPDPKGPTAVGDDAGLGDAGMMDGGLPDPLSGVPEEVRDQLPKWFKVDCDDQDPLVRPYRYESVCATRDINCDGVVARDAIESFEDVWSAEWNTLCSCLTEFHEEEMPGNLHDEDCDGLVSDSDLDGFLSYAHKGVAPGPYDCDDREPRAHPGRAEVAGNHIDEDCDGWAIDWDGDGSASPAAAFARDTAGMTSFSDCDDWNENINASVPASMEAGQASFLYYTDGDDQRRAASYCGYFDEDGSLTRDYLGRELLWRTLRDLNCDGVVTDADGDGLTHPTDLSLGPDVATDCDDIDPRVGAAADCTNIDRSVLLNDSECNATIKPYDPGSTCPVLTLSGTKMFTSCQLAMNADGTTSDTGTCIFSGWWDTNPLTPDAGTTWGPCDGPAGDGANKLPDCPAGTVCGTTQNGDPWTPEFMTYVMDVYTDGEDPSNPGMCFPVCEAQ